MIWKNTSSDERLCFWKKLRKDIEGKSLDEQLVKIAQFCSTIPRGSRSIDYYTPDNWPNPWEIFYYNSFCKNSISLVIFYVLSMMYKDNINIELWVVKDNEGDYLLPVINNQFILNYESGSVSNYADICDYFIIMKKISQDQIRSIT